MLHKKNNDQLPCCLLSDSKVRLLDGREYSLVEGDSIQQPLQKSCEDFIRSLAWYRIDSNATPSCLFNPHNCEQLILHILSFMTKNWDSIISHFRCFFPPDMGWGISVSKMKRLMTRIEQEGLIKNGVEGIEYLKKDL